MSEHSSPTHGSPPTPPGWLEWLTANAWILALAIVLLGALLRADGLFEYWLNPDEGIYYSIVSWPTLGQFWSELQDNAHPPLYFVVLRIVALLSDGFFPLRVVSLVFGCLAIYAMFVLGRELGGTVAGILSALVLAVSPGAIELSVVIRPYMFQLAVLAFALYFLSVYLRSRTARSLWAYAGLMLVAVLTHYSSVLVMGGVGFFLLASLCAGKFSRPEVKSLALVHLPILAALAGLYFFHVEPVMLGSKMQVQAQEEWLRAFMITSPLEIWARLLGVMRYFFGAGFEGPTVLLMIGGLLLAIRMRRHLLYGIPLAVLAVAVLASATKLYPFGCSRHSIYLAVLLGVPIAFALGGSIATGLRGGLIAVILTAGMFRLHNGVSYLVGAGSLTTTPLAERILPAEEMEDLESTLARIRAEGGLVVMSEEAYYSLAPFLIRAREAAVWGSENTYSHFPWGEARVLVNRDEWRMVADDESLGTLEHLFTFLERVDEESPELEIGNQEAASMIFVGSLKPLVRQLEEFDGSLPAGRGVAETVFDAPRSNVLKVNFREYMQQMRARIARRR